MNQKNFFEFSFQDFKHFLNKDVEIEDKKVSMRTKQIWQSVYKKGSFEINNLTTLPIELRNKLNNLISLQRPKIINTQTSSDGTIKWLIQLFDGNEVEISSLVNDPAHADKTGTQFVTGRDPPNYQKYIGNVQATFDQK